MKLIKNKRHRDPRYFLNETALPEGGMLPDDPRQLISDACSEFGQDMVRTLAHQVIDDPRSIISLIEASPAGPKLKEMGISVQDIGAKVEPYLQMIPDSQFAKFGVKTAFDAFLSTACGAMPKDTLKEQTMQGTTVGDVGGKIETIDGVKYWVTTVQNADGSVSAQGKRKIRGSNIGPAKAGAENDARTALAAKIKGQAPAKKGKEAAQQVKQLAAKTPGGSDVLKIGGNPAIKLMPSKNNQLARSTAASELRAWKQQNMPKRGVGAFKLSPDKKHMVMQLEPGPDWNNAKPGAKKGGARADMDARAAKLQQQADKGTKGMKSGERKTMTTTGVPQGQEDKVAAQQAQKMAGKGKDTGTALALIKKACAGGNQAACAELKKTQASDTTTPKPAPAPAAEPAPAAKPAPKTGQAGERTGYEAALQRMRTDDRAQARAARKERRAARPASRGDARKQARARGELTYTWKGKKYGTRGSAEKDVAAFKKKMARIRARRGEERDVAGAMQENKITKSLLKQLIREEYSALYESDEDDMARAAQLARDHSSGVDHDRQSYEEMSADLPRQWPDAPELVDPMGIVPKLPGPKGVADHLYRIKKLIDELPMSPMDKLEYLNQILRGAAPEDDV